MKVRKGDTVIVIAGNDKGKKGAILRVEPAESRVVVEGVNLRWKHKKPTQKDPKGERLQREFPVHASNVMLWDEKLGKGVRKRPAPEAAAKAAKQKKTKK
jgi:large subunit ribosomal protein L24